MELIYRAGGVPGPVISLMSSTCGPLGRSTDYAKVHTDTIWVRLVKRSIDAKTTHKLSKCLFLNLSLRLDRVGIVFIKMTGKAKELSHVPLRAGLCVNNVRYLNVRY